METDGILCPRCQASCTPGTAYCPYCGAPLTAQARVQQIERLLETPPPADPLSTPAVVPTAVPAPIEADSVTPDEGPLVTETAASEPSAIVGAAAGRGAALVARLRPYSWLLIAAGTAFFSLILFVAALTFFRMGYHASPQGVVRGIRDAVRTQNIDLFYNLTDADLGQADTLSMHADMAEPILVDIMQGERGQFAVVVLRVPQATPSPLSSYYGTGLITATLYQRDGKWYMESYTARALLMQLGAPETRFD